jgi:PHD/YefM family antitoxin component YafN of YafNO toxin-antitoxin module
MPKKCFRVTKRGDQITIVLSAKEYENLMEDLDELDSIRAYDTAKNSKDTPVPFE